MLPAFILTFNFEECQRLLEKELIKRNDSMITLIEDEPTSNIQTYSHQLW